MGGRVVADGGAGGGCAGRAHIGRPRSTAATGAAELALAVPSRDAVDALRARRQALGRTELQPPTAMDFGTTFTVQDADGHRLRMFVPEGP